MIPTKLAITQPIATPANPPKAGETKAKLSDSLEDSLFEGS